MSWCEWDICDIKCTVKQWNLINNIAKQVCRRNFHLYIMFMINSLDSYIWLRYGCAKYIFPLFRDEFYSFLVMPCCIFKVKYELLERFFIKLWKRIFSFSFTFVPCILMLSKFYLFTDCFNVNFNIVFKTTHYCISWWINKT